MGKFLLSLGFVAFGGVTLADYKVGDQVQPFVLLDQNGKEVTIAKNKDEMWTVLYFYPKADTPGCTKQACAFRDAIKVIEKEKAYVYGVSTNSVEDLKKFENKYKLNFRLLSDRKGLISKKFGAKYPVLNVSRRYTFILDENLKVRSIDKDVDPVMDAQNVAKNLKILKNVSTNK